MNAALSSRSMPDVARCPFRLGPLGHCGSPYHTSGSSASMAVNPPSPPRTLVHVVVPAVACRVPLILRSPQCLDGVDRMRRYSRIELRNRQIGGQRCPADAGVHGAVHAPVVRQVEGVGAAQGVEYQMVLIHVHVARMGPLERLAAVFGDEQPYAAPRWRAVGVQRMHRKGQGVPADPIAAGARRIDFPPARGTVVGAVDKWSAITPGVLAAVAYGGVQDIRSRGSDGQVDATDVRVTHAAGGTGPAAGRRRSTCTLRPSDWPHRDRWITRVHDQICHDPARTARQVRPLSVERKSPEVRRREPVVDIDDPAVTGSTMTREILAPPLLSWRKTLASCRSHSHVEPPSRDRSTPQP